MKTINLASNYLKKLPTVLFCIFDLQKSSPTHNYFSIEIFFQIYLPPFTVYALFCDWLDYIRMLDRFLASVFDEQHEFADIWELKLIKFDSAFDENLKRYEKHIAVASTIEDAKGNPGVVGNFSLTNLRVIWYAQKDRDINLSIGLDTVNNVFVKSFPIAGYSDMKHVLTVKSMSPGGVKYEFKFAGFGEREERIFRKVADTFKRCVETKYLRNIDTNIKPAPNNEFAPLEFEQFKTRYEDVTFIENQVSKKVALVLTNIRMIVLNDHSREVSYGIPWIMIESFTKTDKGSRDALEIKIRGLLKGVQIFVSCTHRSDFSKMHKQIVSFSESYTKNPTLGTEVVSGEKTSEMLQTIPKSADIEEFQNVTKVNIGRRKNAYGDLNQKGDLRSTFFNQELGIMMEKMPQGVTRSDLWQILPS